MSTILCDGCGQPASPEHIARRVRRLELATRFRPIHIHLLFLAEAPPMRLEDYFYYLPENDGPEPAARTRRSRVLLDGLMRGLGIESQEEKGDEACLAEFQKRGYFLADWLECPMEEIVPGLGDGTAKADAQDLAHRFGPTIVKRVQLSYKPKHIVLLSAHARLLVPIFERAGLSDRLVLDQGLPLPFPYPQDPVAQAQFRAGLAEVLTKVSSRAKGS